MNSQFPTPIILPGSISSGDFRLALQRKADLGLRYLDLKDGFFRQSD